MRSGRSPLDTFCANCAILCPLGVGMATLARQLSQTDERTAHIPWSLWCSALAVTSVSIGAHWDVSWHASIGRDTFWTPAHLAIYLCGVIAGFGGGAVTLIDTFGHRDQERDATVRLWGFRAPLGIFMCIWGAVAMLTSAPFDDWWHN